MGLTAMANPFVWLFFPRIYGSPHTDLGWTCNRLMYY